MRYSEARNARACVQTAAELGASCVAEIVRGTVQTGRGRAVEEDKDIVLELEGRSGVEAEAAAGCHGGTGRHLWIG